MNEQDKIMVEELNKMVISSIPNNKLKVMVIKILTGLEERAEDLSKTSTKRQKTKRNQSDMKNITKINNTIDGISSRLQEAEQISDLEDRIMESNQAEAGEKIKNENRFKGTQ